MLIANDRPPRRAEEPRRFDGAQRRTPLFPTAERPALERAQSPGAATGIVARPELTVPNNRLLPRFSAHSQVDGTFAHVNRCEMATERELYGAIGRCTP